MVSIADNNNMEYRFLGPTGLKVSALGFGNWLTSDKPDFQARTTEMIKRSYELGVNFFDTAEVYGSGEGETAMGKAFKELDLPREQIVVTTKIFWGGKGINDVGLSRKHVIEGAINSLKRLQLDYVDVIYCHRPDYETPLEETCRAFDYLINNGKAFYWGTSEWPADRITEAIGICERLNLHKPIVEQPQYSMLVRERFEKEYSGLFNSNRIGSTIWSPLAGGLLTGKYNQGIPEGSRFDSDNPLLKGIFEREFTGASKEKNLKILNSLADVAKELGCSQAQLALAWTFANKNVSVCLFGATRIEQVEENLKALDVYKKFTPEILAKIETILGNAPEPAMDFRNRTKGKAFR